MKIAIIGSGNVGSALTKALSRAGHTIILGAHHPDKPETKALSKIATITTVAEAPKQAEVIILATPWQSVEDAIKTMGDLSGKILIDCTNPLKPDLSGLAIGQTSSAGEQVAQWAKGAKVVKTFNHTGADNMEHAQFDGARAVMFVCGNDEAAKRTVMQLVSDVGFEAVDAGKIEIARCLEPLAMLWVHMAYQQKKGTGFAYALVNRQPAKTLVNV